jgi:hypothetical protein
MLKSKLPSRRVEPVSFERYPRNTVDSLKTPRALRCGAGWIALRLVHGTLYEALVTRFTYVFVRCHGSL